MLGIGLGVWYGEFDGITRSWIRWYDADGHWIPNNEERILQEQRAREQAESQLRQVVLNLLQSGMSIEQAAQLTGLSEAEIRQLR